MSIFRRRRSGITFARINKMPFLTAAFKAAIAAITLAGSFAHAATAPDNGGISRTNLEHHLVPGTDMEMRMDLIVIPPGVSSPSHHHSVTGFSYILEGTAESAYGDEKPRIFHAGDSLEERALVPHTLFRNMDDHAPLRFLLYYTVKVDQPFLVVP